MSKYLDFRLGNTCPYRKLFTIGSWFEDNKRTVADMIHHILRCFRSHSNNTVISYIIIFPYTRNQNCGRNHAFLCLIALTAFINSIQSITRQTVFNRFGRPYMNMGKIINWNEIPLGTGSKE